MHTSLWAAIADRADRTPDAEMMVDERGRRMTFAGYRDAAERHAAYLHGLGVGAGTPVTWQLPTWIEAAVVVAALARLGAAQNPVMPIYRERELAFVTRQTGAALLIVPRAFRGHDHEATARAVAAGEPGLEVLVLDGPLPEGDPATLPPPPPVPASPGEAPVRWHFYTSGTTSDPKGARHTDATVMAGGAGMAERLRCAEADRVALVFPFAHIGGCTTWLTASLLSGVTMILTEHFDPEATTELLAREGVTLGTAGTVFHQAYLARQRLRPDVPLFPDVRLFPGGAAPKPPRLHYEVKAELGGAGICAGWGLTEAPILSMAGPEDDDRVLAECEGRPTRGVSLRVVTADGRVAGPGEEGELRARGPQVMLGYLDPALDADAFDDEGWFRTGDLGRLDEHGNVTITGRLKDVIIRKGETISAKEVEDLLAGHPAVAEVAVVGLPDEAAGEIACAVVVPADPGAAPDLAGLTAHLSAAGLMRQKHPERLEIVPVLPRNPAGKVLKKQLRNAYAPATA